MPGFEEFGFSPQSTVTACHNYAKHLRERRKMMQAWASYRDELREQARKRTQATGNAAPKPMNSSAASAR
jgi:hypothetical protein